MRIFKGIIYSLLSVLIFTSSSFALISKSADFFGNTYSRVEDFIIKVSRVSEVQYEEFFVSDSGMDNAFYSLNEKQQGIYKTIYSISQKMPEGFVKVCENYSGAERDIAVAYNAFLYDRVEIFWMPYIYIVSTYEDSGKEYSVISFSTEYNGNKIDYDVSKSQRDKMIVTLNSKIEKILNKAQDFTGKYEKEKFFNDYICENTDYQPEGELVSTVYGALINKKAHCEGYSRAFKLLCNKVGIGCDMVCGTSEGEGHMWNLVNLDGIYSYVDVTWNDQSQQNCTYMYFNITTEQLNKDHKIAPLHHNLSDAKIEEGSFNFISQPATFTGNTYYAKTGNVLELNFAPKAAEIVENANSRGENYAEMLITSKIATQSIKADDMKFVNEIQSYLPDIKLKSFAFDRDILILYWD